MKTIYMIQNKENGRIYIGQTSKKKPEYRWTDHLYRLRNGDHPNFKLLKDFKQFGEGAFKFVPLLKVKNSEATSREQALIEHYNAYYNIRLNKSEVIWQ